MSTEKQLVEFGNFLLSEERSKSIINKNNINKVHHSYIENWKESNKNL